MRAFFAVDLDEGARRAAAAVARELRPAAGDVRWVRPEAYHVTLRFLGEVEPERAEALAAEAGAAVAPVAAFRLHLGAARAFPSPRRPRVVALELSPEPPLAALAGRLEAVAVGAGLAAEERPFRSHLTLGRVRRGGRLRLSGAPEAGADFDVDEVVLFESELRPGGSRYTARARLPLSSSSRTSIDSPSKGESNGQA